ncbi:MAG: amidohydrolase, partial [Spirochaetales bacterium]|nr:amidohydrolase [Spirochaetales bacterium]
MDLLIKNAQILPMTEEGLSFNGSIGVDYGKIVFIGKEPDFFKAKHVIDADHMLALPGLVNAHTHLSMTDFR